MYHQMDEEAVMTVCRIFVSVHFLPVQRDQRRTLQRRPAEQRRCSGPNDNDV
jgi:hypothetical protein